MQSQEQFKRAIVIYHDNCVDGFASAWAFHRLKEKDYERIQYIPCEYGKNPFSETTMILGPKNTIDLYIVDFSFPRNIITNIHNIFNKIIILDHHKTAKEALENWEDKPENVEIVFDMDRSGAGITWDYFSDQHPICPERPVLINYVEDRDLWKFRLAFSKAVNAYIGTQSKSFLSYDNADHMLTAQMDTAIEIGLNLQVQLNSIQESIISQCRRKITINGQVGLVCNCNGMFASEIGNILAKESGTYGATYFHCSDDSVKFSLRSNGDYDVAEIAKLFGGGGHKNAAGFVLSDGEAELEDGVIIWHGNVETKGIDQTKQPDLGEPNAG